MWCCSPPNVLHKCILLFFAKRWHNSRHLQIRKDIRLAPTEIILTTKTKPENWAYLVTIGQIFWSPCVSEPKTESWSVTKSFKARAKTNSYKNTMKLNSQIRTSKAETCFGTKANWCSHTAPAIRKISKILANLKTQNLKLMVELSRGLLRNKPYTILLNRIRIPKQIEFHRNPNQEI